MCIFNVFKVYEKKLHSLHDNLISLQLTNVFRDCIAEDFFNVTQGYQIGGQTQVHLLRQGLHHQEGQDYSLELMQRQPQGYLVEFLYLMESDSRHTSWLRTTKT